MGEIEARAWLRSALVGDAGFTENEADRVVDGVFAKPRGLRERAESVATAAYTYATARLAEEGTRRWETAGGRAKERLLDGDADEYAEGSIAEIVDPAPDCWDPNWPDYKTFHAVEIPADKSLGDTFVVGDGLDTRGRFRVEDRSDGPGAVLIESWWVLQQETRRARAEASQAFG